MTWEYDLFRARPSLPIDHPTFRRLAYSQASFGSHVAVNDVVAWARGLSGPEDGPYAGEIDTDDVYPRGTRRTLTAEWHDGLDEMPDEALYLADAVRAYTADAEALRRELTRRTWAARRASTDPFAGFWVHVHKTESCWIWTGSVDGERKYGTTSGNYCEEKSAHRVAYFIANGPVPDGLEVDHTCGVTRCVNPAHLEAVTRDENQRRAVQRRRQMKEAAA